MSKTSFVEKPAGLLLDQLMNGEVTGVVRGCCVSSNFVLVEVIFLFASVVSHTASYLLVFLLGEALYTVQFSVYSERKLTNLSVY